MKTMFGLGFFCLICLPAFAQTGTLLEDFDTGVPPEAVPDWIASIGFSSFLYAPDGNPNVCMRMQDTGWSSSGTRTYSGVVPEDGNYYLSFDYKNGDASTEALRMLRVRLNGEGEMYLSGDPATKVLTWTPAQTGSVYGLNAGADITVEIVGYAQTTVTQCAFFDNFKIIKGDSFRPSLMPFDGMYISGSQTLTGYISGGSVNIVKAEFDINADGSFEGTDTSPEDGFTYELDTFSVVSGIGDVDVRLVVTDADSATGEVTYTYTIDNTHGRTEHLVNGGFEGDWPGGIPEGWTAVYYDASGASGNQSNVSISSSTSDPHSGSKNLQIRLAANDVYNRYTLISNSFPGNLSDYIVAFACKGADSRLCYFQSNDGIAWESTWHMANPSAAADFWKELLDPVWAGPGTEYMAICTHKYQAADSHWDSVSVSSRSATAPETPTQTEVATQTHTPTDTPVETPTETVTSTPTILPNGSADINNDGIVDAKDLFIILGAFHSEQETTTP